MITSQVQICSFCAQPIGGSNPDHPCPSILYSVTNTIAQARQDSPSLLGDIHNLVFQGGGIKGLAYLGSLRQLQIEGQKDGKDFLSGVHRIAGTSAGSMVALYLGLNLSLDNDIEPLLKRNFVDLLDNSLILKVAVNLDSWGGIWNLISDPKYENYGVGDILGTAMKCFKDFEERINSGDSKVEEKVQKEMQDLFKPMFKYLAIKLSKPLAYGSIGYFFVGDSDAKSAAKWLIDLLKSPKPKDAKKTPLKATFAASSTSESPSKFEDIMDLACDEALIELNQASTADVQEKPKLLSAGVKTEGLQTASQENPKEDLRPVFSAKKQENLMIADALEYLERKNRSDIKPEPASKLTGKTFANALAEFIWFIIISRQNAAGIRQELGLFDGSIVKRELIEVPILNAVGKLHSDPANITFQELWDLNSQLPAEKKFKKFYVTSFNVETFRTEVFSVDHTPNVVVADAVRASISIPIFFTPVTIRERKAKGLTERKVYSPHGAEIIVHYMDGGVLDNYPIWIFDDFKYCVQDIPGFKPRMKYGMQNPHTLGFRLLDTRIIDIYTNPYFDAEKQLMRQINEKKFTETFSYQIGLLLNTEISQTQENEHIKRGDCARTAYVDNLGINAIQFVLSEDEIRSLINAGAESVVNYKKRAALNGFVGEGEAYF